MFATCKCQPYHASICDPIKTSDFNPLLYKLYNFTRTLGQIQNHELPTTSHSVSVNNSYVIMVVMVTN